MRCLSLLVKGISSCRHPASPSSLPPSPHSSFLLFPSPPLISPPYPPSYSSLPLLSSHQILFPPLSSLPFPILPFSLPLSASFTPCTHPFASHSLLPYSIFLSLFFPLPLQPFPLLLSLPSPFPPSFPSFSGPSSSPAPLGARVAYQVSRLWVLTADQSTE